MSDLPEDLPEDLVAPLGVGCCGGEVWLAPIWDVVAAASGQRRLVSPCCGHSFGVTDICKIAFVSRAEWEAAGDDDNDAPQSYFVGHVEFTQESTGEVAPPCAEECIRSLAALFAKDGVEAHVSHLPPLVESAHEAFSLICPHGFKWFAAPTSEQIAQWAEDGVE